MTDLLTAIGLLLVLEGLLYGAFPNVGRKLGELLLTTPENTLRTSGLLCAFAGIVIVWMVRG
ncbi:MAG: DUF2065 family protein [Pseudomonadota bacterium]